MNDIIQNILFLIFYSFGISLLNIIVYKFFDNSNSKFKSLKDSKKLYLVKNTTKSFVLSYICIKICIMLYYIIISSKLKNDSIKQLASLYVSNDLVALIFVPKLPKTTIYHHVTSLVLLFINYAIDYEDLTLITTNIGILLIGYTIFSSFAFIVNLYLGMRYIIQNKIILNNLRIVSLKVYTYSLFLNWTSQVLYIVISTYLNIKLIFPYIVYSIVLIPIINDDLILVSWLKKN